MAQKNSFGKLPLLLIAAGIISFTGVQNVSAAPQEQAANSYHHNMNQEKQLSGKMLKNRDTFLQKTKKLRKEMAIKRAKMQAFMQAATPDPERVAILAGELFDLREQLRLQALENGLPGRPFMGPMGMGCTMMQNGGPLAGAHHSPSS